MGRATRRAAWVIAAALGAASLGNAGSSAVAAGAGWAGAGQPGAAPQNPDGFADPLDVPAASSALAARRPLLAVAQAGRRLVAVGQRGHILRSDDGGASWSQSASPVSVDLTAVWFATPEQGWAVGHGAVVLATRDGGATWRRQLDARSLAPLLGSRGGGGLAGAATSPPGGAVPDADAPLLDVWFADARHGWAVGAFNLVIRTEDGGETWRPWHDRVENPRGLHLYAVRATGGSLLLAGEQGLLLRLDEGRQRFVARRAPGQGSWFGLTGTAGAVVAFGLRGQAAWSGDGGASWRRVETGLDEPLVGGAALPDGRLALLGLGGQLLLSADAGRTFQPVERRSPGPAFALASDGAGGLVLVGPAGPRVAPLREEGHGAGSSQSAR